MIVLAGVIGKFVIKPNPQKLAKEIVDNLKTMESYNVERRFCIRILVDCELNDIKYTKVEGAESHITIWSRMKVTNDPYHLDTEGSVTQRVTLYYGGEIADENEIEYQLTSDEKD